MMIRSLLIATLVLASPITSALEYTADLGVETQLFNQSGAPNTHKEGLALSLQPSWVHQNDQGDVYYTFTPFFRWDQHDDNRTHADIRELKIIKVWDKWEVEAGLVKVFWGVAESNHLVDVINQTDFLEGLDGEDKLGQPMLRLSHLYDQSSLSFYVLPGFRERDYAGESSRFALPFSINANDATFESSDEERHIDYALRFSGYKGQLDYGISWFDGTSRDAQLLPTTTDSSVFIPHYQQIERASVDLQYTKDAWLFKLEAINQRSNSADYSAFVSGFEYTFYGLNDGAYDLGVIAELNNDSRDNAQTIFLQNDLFLGARLAFNDAQSSSILAGAIVDLEDDSRSIRMEASRRVLDNATLDIELQAFSHVDQQNVIFNSRDNDFIKLDFTVFF